MKILITLTLAFISTSIVLCQTDVEFYNEKAFEYYNLGIQAIHDNNLVLADSMFSESYKHEINSNSLYNRALVRLALKDTCSACEDLTVASFKLMDTEAKFLLLEKCMSSTDTLYKNKQLKLVSNKTQYEFIEIVAKPKCPIKTKNIAFVGCDFEYDNIGFTHRKNGESLTAGYFESTDYRIRKIKQKTFGTYAIFFERDSIKYYSAIFGSGFLEKNQDLLVKFTQDYEKAISGKYYLSNLSPSEKKLTMVLFIDETGAVTNYELTSEMFNILEVSVVNDIKRDSGILIKRWLKFKPEKLLSSYVAKVIPIVVFYNPLSTFLTN